MAYILGIVQPKGTILAAVENVTYKMHAPLDVVASCANAVLVAQSKSRGLQ